MVLILCISVAIFTVLIVLLLIDYVSSNNTDTLTKQVIRSSAHEGIHCIASSVIAWFRICYAKSSVNKLHYISPVDSKGWAGLCSAQNFGYLYLQTERYYGWTPNDVPYGFSVVNGFGKRVSNEDYLTLNSWGLAKSKGALSVIIFLHHANNDSRYSADFIYKSKVVAKKANSVVTTNFNLGILSWLNFMEVRICNVLIDSEKFVFSDANKSRCKSLSYSIIATLTNFLKIGIRNRPVFSIN
ncbi:carboxylesterase family protein [Acinetobacter seifertii]|uniref:carboxylesterase family protein n=1 Tax=Acinetobacter seifertii TaxID=1530123 RepID=UPI00280ED221|nr:carboxylesterase family protein [Acinetobacter seifertii]MDQ9037267.1 carboxylesterase family protein [Acinetobacter seifertii]